MLRNILFKEETQSCNLRQATYREIKPLLSSKNIKYDEFTGENYEYDTQITWSVLRNYLSSKDLRTDIQKSLHVAALLEIMSIGLKAIFLWIYGNNVTKISDIRTGWDINIKRPEDRIIREYEQMEDIDLGLSCIVKAYNLASRENEKSTLDQSLYNIINDAYYPIKRRDPFGLIELILKRHRDCKGTNIWIDLRGNKFELRKLDMSKRLMWNSYRFASLKKLLKDLY